MNNRTQKKCTECEAERPLVDFYRHNAMAGGRLHQCKECVKTRVRKHRLANIDRIREYDRNRPNADERAEINRENYRKRTATPEGRASEWAKQKAWAQNNSEKRQAHIIAGNAIRAGALTPRPCGRCGDNSYVHAHHEDYSRPLDVVWLCRTCHGARHREINAKVREAQHVSK